MNVIIRLQNLPWSANALDIRQFFKGLSIPDGGVHIVGGEMGDAFIAFSTDEDARQAMMHDREAINGVQVRLLLSSRAEMQKVIETARQQSLKALQNTAAAITVPPPKRTPPSTVTMTTNPQPPVITPNSLHCILSNSISSVAPSFLAYQQQAGITLMSKAAPNNNTLNNVESNISPKHREYHANSREQRSRSRSRSCSRSRSKEHNSTRRRRERSRERSKDREAIVGVRRRSLRSRDRSYERSRSRSRERSLDRGRERSRSSHHNNRDNKNRSRDSDAGKSKSNISAWDQNIKNIYGTQKTGQESVEDTQLAGNVSKDSTTIQKSLTSMNNYSLNSFLGRSNSNMGFALQNPYTAASNSISLSDSTNNLTTTSSSAIPGIFVEKKSDEIASTSSQSVTETTLLQDSIVFADTNPYEKMYPKLFAQAASIGTVNAKPSVLNKNVQSSPNSPREDDTKSRDSDSHKTRCVKIMNMCPGTTYSDIRKFCVGLYIPHNGIKMVNDGHGLRVGVAYIQFSKYACVTRVLSRNNHLLRNKAVIIQAVSEEEFENVMDSFHPDNRDKSSFGGRGEYNSNTSDSQHNSSNPFKNQGVTEPYNVLYIEDIPSLTTEQDIMKMFSSYSLYDILLMPSPENRREFVAHVRFSREEDALLAFEDKAHHQIGYRRLRVRPGSVEEMDRAKEKIRLANEQLMKEEQEAAEEEVQRKQYEEEARIRNHKEVISLDLTQSDGEGGDDMEDVDDFIDSTNKLIDNVVKNDDDSNYEDRYDFYKDHDNPTDTDSRNYNGDLPSHFDAEPVANCPSFKVNDPRLRKAQRGTQPGNGSNTARPNKDSSNFNNFNPNFNDQQSSHSPTINSIEHNFVILKNCDYNTRINDVAQLLITANLALKHIEPLHNERQLPTGEFIVEFRRTQDTEVAVQRFHNIQFMSRSLRVFPITPQEIADRLAKPFLGYIPGGNGIKISDLKTLAAAMNVGQMNNASNNMDYNGGKGNYPGRCGSNNRFDEMDSNNDNNEAGDFNENNNGNGLPERFQRPGCVLELENVPYKAQLTDILNFFKGFNLKPDDIVRRFNDNGQPTGDARVVFDSPEDARKAIESRRRKQIFNRTVYLNIL